MTANQTVRLRVTGRNFGTPAASFDHCLVSAGSSALVHAATGITEFASTGFPPRHRPSSVWFAMIPTPTRFSVDDVTVLAIAAAPPAADYSLVPPDLHPCPTKSSIFPASIRTWR